MNTEPSNQAVVPTIDCEFDNWHTVDAIVLPPGWLNVWTNDNGRKVHTPCPAMLRQELRSTTLCYSNGHFRESPNELPYAVRIVAGLFVNGELEDVTDTSNYVATVHESERDLR